MEAHPEEAVLLLEDRVEVCDLDVGDPPAIGVGGTVDHFTHDTSSLPLSSEVRECLPTPTTPL